MINKKVICKSDGDNWSREIFDGFGEQPFYHDKYIPVFGLMIKFVQTLVEALLKCFKTGRKKPYK